MTITRRELMISGVKILSGGGLLLMIEGCSPDGESTVIDISSVFSNPDRFYAIGSDYRRQFPKEVSSGALGRRVFDEFSDTLQIDGEVNRRLAALIRLDFAKDHVFFFHDWILSHTEGQLCALALR